MSFAQDLDSLIKKHAGRPKEGDDLQPIIDTLYEAADKMAKHADQFSYKHETEREFKARRRWHAAT